MDVNRRSMMNVNHMYNDMHDECEGDAFIAQKNDAIDANNEQREEPKQMVLTGSPRLLCRSS